MKTTILPTAFFTVMFNVAISQQVVIKGTLRCAITTTTSTKGAVNIIIIPSFNPAAAVATTTNPQGFFQISTGWKAKDLLDKNVSLYLITKCSSCKKVERVFIAEDLDKRNTDPTKLYVTIKGWKLLENCMETELPDILAEKLLDSAHRLPAQDISGKASGSAAMAPLSFINLFEKLVTIAATQNSGLFKAISIPPGKIRYGIFLHSSPLTNTDNTGFNFSPSRNLSEAVFWNAAAIANSSKPNNVSMLANFKNNIKLSGYQQLSEKLYLGLGGIYTKQDEIRQVVYRKADDLVNGFTAPVNHPEKLQEFAVFLAPVYKISERLNVGVTGKSIWQQFNNPNLVAMERDNNVNYNFFGDDTIYKQHFDADVSFCYKINSFIQAGVSVMNIAGTKLYADMFVPDSANQMYRNQRAYGAGLCFKKGRLNVGGDVLLTDDGYYDAAVGINYVPFNDALIAGGYAFKQKSYSVSFKLKHFRVAYIEDNNLVINELKEAKSKIFDGRIYSGFIFNF
jgi:hypothetical protein